MENQPMVASSKNHWKTVGIILVVLVIGLGGALGYLIWKNNDKGTQIGNLNSQVEKLETEKNEIINTNDNPTTPDIQVVNTGAHGYILKQLQEVYGSRASGPSGDVGKLSGTLSVDYHDNGYASVSTNVGFSDGSGATEMFYRTSDDSDWKYFMGTQSPLLCKDFNTADIRKAFIEYTCFDTNNNTNSVGAHYKLI
jgi:nitrate reductase NapE component